MHKTQGISRRMRTLAEGRVPTQLQPCEVEYLLEGATRPYVLINERELSVLRRGLTKKGWKASLYHAQVCDRASLYDGIGLHSLAKEMLGKSVTIPDRAGHFHHLFCDDGVHLGRRPDGSFECRACGRRYSGERYEAAHRHLEHNLLARGTLALGLVYAIERDKRYAAKAAEILLQYARAYPGPHTSLTEGGIFYNSLDEAVWIIRLAQAYDLIHDSQALSEEEKAEIKQKLFRPAAIGLIKLGIDGNWGSWHLSAVGVVGLAIKDAEMVWYAVESLGRQLTEQLGEDGLWPESVHTYHFYALRAFVALAEGCYRIGIDLYGWEASPGKSLQAMFRAPVYYAYPTLQLPAINDGWWASAIPLDLYEIACRRWPDTFFGWVLKTGYGFASRPVGPFHIRHRDLFERRSLYAFLFGRDLLGRGPQPDYGSVHFPTLGICVLRKGDESFLTFDYGPFLAHGQLDKMSVTFYANGHVFVPDYGTPGYGSKILPWFVGTASHNTVVVDGESQKPTQERALRAFRPGREVQMAEAETLEAYPGVRHIRRVVMIGGGAIIQDFLSSDDEHIYDMLIRLDAELELEPEGLQPSEEEFRYEHVNIKEAFLCRGSWYACAAAEGNPDRSGLVTGFQSGHATVALAEAPAYDGASRCSLLISRQRARECSFMTILYPARTASAAKSFRAFATDAPSPSVRQLVVSHREQCSDYVFLADPRAESDSAPTAAFPLRTDAKVTVVRVHDGRPALCAVIDGSFVEWKGETLARAYGEMEHLEVVLGGRYPLVNYRSASGCTLSLKSPSRFVKLQGRRFTGRLADGMVSLELPATD